MFKKKNLHRNFIIIFSNASNISCTNFPSGGINGVLQTGQSDHNPYALGVSRFGQIDGNRPPSFSTTQLGAPLPWVPGFRDPLIAACQCVHHLVMNWRERREREYRAARKREEKLHFYKIVKSELAMWLVLVHQKLFFLFFFGLNYPFVLR